MRGYCTLGKFVEEGFATPGAGFDATGGGTISGCFAATSDWPNVAGTPLPRKNQDPATAAPRTSALTRLFFIEILLNRPRRIRRDRPARRGSRRKHNYRASI